MSWEGSGVMLVKAGDMEASEGAGRVFGVVGVVWRPLVGRRRPDTVVSSSSGD